MQLEQVSAPELRRKASAFGLDGELPLAFILLRPAERGTRAAGSAVIGSVTSAVMPSGMVPAAFGTSTSTR